MVKKRRPHDELKPAIVIAAEQAIRDGGVQGVTARGLAEVVGVSVGTLYNLFGNLDGIVRAVNLETTMLLHHDLTTRLAGAEQGTEARLCTMAEVYFDFALDQPHRWEALFHYRPETPRAEDLQLAEAALFSLLRQTADGARETVGDDALRTLWAAVHGVVELAIAQRLAGQDIANAREHVRLVVQAGLRGFRALQEEGLL